MKNKRAQTAFEYMGMLGLALVILGGLVSISYIWIINSRETVALSAAENSVFRVVEAADLVYAQGYPAKITVLIQVPDNIDSTSVQGKVVAIRLRVKDGVTDVTASSKADLIGSMPSSPGYYRVTVQSFGDYVNVSRA